MEGDSGEESNGDEDGWETTSESEDEDTLVERLVLTKRCGIQISDTRAVSVSSNGNTGKGKELEVFLRKKEEEEIFMAKCREIERREQEKVSSLIRVVASRVEVEEQKKRDASSSALQHLGGSGGNYKINLSATAKSFIPESERKKRRQSRQRETLNE